jgi:RNA polymerase sigma-70 factor (ECF subfamily)
MSAHARAALFPDGDLARPVGGPGQGSPVSAPSEEDLVRRARAGDRAAFGALYERFAPMVHGILLARVSAREAQDLVQDVFLAALDSIAGLADDSRMGAWLAAIARNRAQDQRRSQRPAHPGVELVEILDTRGDDLPDAERAEDAERALAALRGLPEAYRETLVLRLVEGLDGPTIAERTGMTHGSVRVNLCKGMKLLRERLSGER